MSAKLIEGIPLAAQFRADIAREVKALHEQGKRVRLACIQVGEKPESLLYVKNQKKLCGELGIEFEVIMLPDAISQNALIQKIHELNDTPEVTGIILELPLPARINTFLCQRAISPQKDAEGVHPVNLGLLVYGVAHHAPCTAMAAYQLIKSTGVELRGKEVTVVGHSQIVGKPISLMLLHDFCTVTTCHIATRDLAAHTRNADVLVVAVGKAGLIKASMVKPGAMIIDVGVNRVPVLDPSGKPVLNDKGRPKFATVGDVEFDGVKDIAGWITPVPGGVGPVTVTMLLRNVAEAAKHDHGLNI
ncbi:MAG TPA: bifunctional 5,10-methylenetetrahydrofolate dehydrogenase/5,10-methenyltetrahydrofolate cyclohydrolase [Planctomycetota bacterium]|nr:bifunctional 5,10-methylenetetrahydrofolate dehydrogenase/5,10-methenyltetrahydrofolate cyclohydrolase [Planctomycetota bacterium]